MDSIKTEQASAHLTKSAARKPLVASGSVTDLTAARKALPRIETASANEDDAAWPSAPMGEKCPAVEDSHLSSQEDSARDTVEEPAADQVTYSFSSGLIDRLARLRISLAFTSYQSGFLYMLGSDPESGAQLHQSAVQKPMGLSIDDDGGLTLACGASVIRYRNVLRGEEKINHIFDACFMPRSLHMTGGLDAHDVARDRHGRAVFVNTRYNCLATLSETHSFEALWRPPFISSIVDEDRCHLNGLAMAEGRPAYVTAVSRSDTIDGWRDRRRSGGVVVDVRSNEVICEGLSMPHSPRVHRGELWILNAGTGELGVVNRSGGGMGVFEPRVFCPGFVRGLAFHGNLAFVGLSKPRYSRFEGLDLDQRLRDADSEPWCGVQVIDLDKLSCVDWIRIDGAVQELYDLAIISGHVCPMAVSPQSDDAISLVTVADKTIERVPSELAPPAAAQSSARSTQPTTLARLRGLA